MKGIELLSAWMELAGIDKGALDSSGRVLSFIYGKSLPVTVESPAYSDDIFIIIEVAKAESGEIRRKRMEKSMQINAYALETRGAVLGWDIIGERIILSHRVTAEDATAAVLDNIIANLIEVAEKVIPELSMEQEVAVQQTLASSVDNMFQPIKP